MVKDDDTRLAELQAKRQQKVEELATIRKEERRIKARRTRAERAIRTRRLIEVGAIVEKAIGTEFDTDLKREALQNVLHESTITRREGRIVTLDKWLALLLDSEIQRIQGTEAGK